MKFFSGRWQHLPIDRGRIALRYPDRPGKHFVYAGGECVGICRHIALDHTEGTFSAESMPHLSFDAGRVLADGFYGHVKPRVVVIKGRPVVFHLELIHEADVHEGVVTADPIPPPPRQPELTNADRERLLVRPFYREPVQAP